MSTLICDDVRDDWEGVGREKVAILEQMEDGERGCARDDGGGEGREEERVDRCGETGGEGCSGDTVEGGVGWRGTHSGAFSEGQTLSVQ